MITDLFSSAEPDAEPGLPALLDRACRGVPIAMSD